jgi:hypothetical protein
VLDAPQPWKALEGAQLEELVEQEGRGLVTRSVRLCEKAEGLIERRARRGRRCGVDPRERRRAGDGAEEPLGRRRGPLDVDVLGGCPAEAVAQLVQDRCPARAAPTHQDGNARWRRIERGGNAADQRGARR